MTLIEDLLDLQIPESLKLSPNAQQVLYATDLPVGHKKGEHHLSTLWLAETGKTGSSHQLTSGLFHDHDPEWCPDGKSISLVSDRTKPGEQWAIYILPIGTAGEAYPITPVENEQEFSCTCWSPDGTSIAYCSADEKSAEKKAKIKDKDDPIVWDEDWEYNRLRLVHVATRKTTTLVSKNAHVGSLAWNDEGTKIAFTETKTPDIESKYVDGTPICILDVATKEIEMICTFPNAMQDLVWAQEKLYFIGPVKPEVTVGADCVYMIDLNAEKPTYERCAHGETDCANELKKVGKDAVVCVESGLEDQLCMLKGKTLFKKSKNINDWDAAFTTDSDEMILAITMGDTDSPPEVFTVTASGGAMVQLSNHGEAFKDQTFGIASLISCQSTSVAGEEPVRLDGVFVTPHTRAGPDGKPEKPVPTVVSIHGGPYSRNTDQFNPAYNMWTPLLLSQGYGILTINYRGSSGRGEDFAAFARGTSGIYDQPDIISMTQYAIKNGYADKDKLVVSGWSQGGFLSFLCSVRNGLHENGWKFKASIPGAGVSDGDTLAFTSDIGAVQNDLTGKAPWQSEMSDTSNRRSSAIWEFAGAVKKGGVIPPMLILHGENDKRVPIEQAVGMRRALQSAGLPFEFVMYPREPHLFEERKHLVDMAGRVLRFVNTHIGGK